MPMLKFKAIEVEKVCIVSKKLINELEELIQCPRDYFSLSVDRALYVKDGDFVKGEAVVEVSWFDRGQAVQDRAAKIITKHINSVGYKNVDVIFYPLEKNNYYENGEHF
ncbi:MAG: DUF1904 family protein [Clostridium sp.]|uniref:DUF1904 family protein n=1 Tax=Clostridium sp. TaxID=1506 RepID=UPI0025BC605E|nr:DUF1904 family protein [Clostridium sp.]MCF0148142.1 DUF1904 family protein [Clostridium sp.]